MIDGLIDIVILLAMLVGLVLVHELGHFVMAKRAGVIVHEFGIGFPPRARVLFRRGETIYTLNWLPIGGFVRLEGEEGRPGAADGADGADGADAEAVDADGRLLPENEAGRSLVAAGAGEPVRGDGVVRDPRAFVNQRLGTRLRILAAGVVVNFVLAWLIFTLVALFADPVFQVRVGGVLPGSPAEAAGIQPGRIVGYTDHVPIVGADGRDTGETQQFPIYDDSGDLIVAVDGHQFPVVDEMVSGPDAVEYRFPPLRYLAERPGQTVVLTVQRTGGEIEDVEVTLRPPAEAAERGALGIEGYKVPQADTQNGLVESAVMGFERTVQASTLVLRGVGSLIGSIFDGGDSEVPVSGPVGIVSIVGDIRAVAPPIFLIILAGLLSANLAVINALPFPPMDGGRFAIALLQAASRNSISPAAERLVYLTGFVLLMMLLVWVTASDVQRLFE